MDTVVTLENALCNLGFTSKEAAVYIALVTLGSSTAYKIAEKCRVKKPTVYVVLEELREKGLVLKVPHPKKAIFSACNLEEYLAEQSEKLRATTELLPLLAKLRAEGKSQVYFYSGLKGMHEALAYKFNSMDDKEYLSCYCSLEGCSKEVMEVYDQWDKMAVAHDMRFKVLRAMTRKGGRADHMRHLTVEEQKNIKERYIKNELYPGNISFEVAENFVRITDAKNLFATIIDDSSTAEALRQILLIAWEQGVSKKV